MLTKLGCATGSRPWCSPTSRPGATHRSRCRWGHPAVDSRAWLCVGVPSSWPWPRSSARSSGHQRRPGWPPTMREQPRRGHRRRPRQRPRRCPRQDPQSRSHRSAQRAGTRPFNGETRGGRAPGEDGEPTDPAASDATLALRAHLAVHKHELLPAPRWPRPRVTSPARPTPTARGTRPLLRRGRGDAGLRRHRLRALRRLDQRRPIAHRRQDRRRARLQRGSPDYIEIVLDTTIHVHDTYVDAGYRSPKGDGSRGGGSNKTDIYIADIGDDGLYGYCTSDQEIPTRGPFDARAYCVLDDDYAATEFPTNTALENLQGDGRPRVLPRGAVRLRPPRRTAGSSRPPRPGSRTRCTPTSTTTCST